MSQIAQKIHWQIAMKEFIFVLVLAALPLLSRSKDAPTHAILVSGPGHSRSGCGANMSFDVSIFEIKHSNLFDFSLKLRAFTAHFAKVASPPKTSLFLRKVTLSTTPHAIRGLDICTWTWSKRRITCKASLLITARMT
jgi:hypothetical protein